MVTQAIPAQGTLLKIGDGGGTEVFTTIAEVKDISGPGGSLNTIEVTNQDSPSGVKEIIGGILDEGQVTFDINWIPTNATHNATAGLKKDQIDKTLRNFKLVWPNAASTTAAFSAFVTGFSPSAAVADALTASVALDISGVVTWS